VVSSLVLGSPVAGTDTTLELEATLGGVLNYQGRDGGRILIEMPEGFEPLGTLSYSLEISEEWRRGVLTATGRSQTGANCSASWLHCYGVVQLDHSPPGAGGDDNSEWEPATTFRLTLQLVRARPFAGATGAFNIVVTSAAGQLSARGAAAGVTLVPNELASAALLPVRVPTATMRGFNVSFTTANVVPPNVDLIVSLPPGLLLTVFLAVRSPALGAALSLNAAYSDRATVTVKRRGGTVLPRGAAVELLFTGLSTRGLSGATGEVGLEMRVAEMGTMDVAPSFPGPHLHYRAPEAREATPCNAGVLGGAVVTVSGAHFGPAEANSNTPAPFVHRAVAVGGSVSAETLWTSDSSLACRVLAGLGSSLRLVVTIENQRCSSAALLSYDAPRPVAADPTNLPGGGGAPSVALTGSGFGAVDFSPQARLGGSGAEQSAWGADSALLCRAAGGGGARLAVAVTAGGQAGSAPDALSFDTPALSALDPGAISLSNAARDVRVLGSGFAPQDGSPRARLGGTACESTAWVSATALRCAAASGAGQARPAAVTASGLAGSLAAAAAYEAPALEPRAARGIEAGDLLVLEGAAGGGVAYTARGRVGGTACESSVWASSSALQCKVPRGSGAALPAVVTVASAAATAQRALTYSTPGVAALLRANLPAGGGADAPHMVMVGSRRQTEFTAQARLGGTACEASAWVSSTALQCRAAAGAGGLHSTVVTLAGIPGTLVSSPPPLLTPHPPLRAPPPVPPRAALH